MKCPNCQVDVVNENINIQTDMGKCQVCNHIFRISENFDTPSYAFDINQPQAVLGIKIICKKLN
jgi:hypothetical protein